MPQINPGGPIQPCTTSTCTYPIITRGPTSTAYEATITETSSVDCHGCGVVEVGNCVHVPIVSSNPPLAFASSQFVFCFSPVGSSAPCIAVGRSILLAWLGSANFVDTADLFHDDRDGLGAADNDGVCVRAFGHAGPDQEGLRLRLRLRVGDTTRCDAVSTDWLAARDCGEWLRGFYLEF